MKLPAIVLFILAACATAPQRIVLDSLSKPVNVFRFTPPEIYETWWVEVAACEHLPLPPQHHFTTWLIVPSRPFEFQEDSSRIVMDAAANGDENKIYVNHTGLFDKFLIMHEQAHLLLFWKFNGKYSKGTIDETHPAPYYEQCGLVVRGQQKI